MPTRETRYLTEKAVGKAIKKSGIPRHELFVTTKLWNHQHHPDDVPAALQQSLDDLAMDYVDLYLVHWPVAWKRGEDLFPKKDNNFVLEEIDFVDVRNRNTFCGRSVWRKFADMNPRHTRPWKSSWTRARSKQSASPTFLTRKWSGCWRTPPWFRRSIRWSVIPGSSSVRSLRGIDRGASISRTTRHLVIRINSIKPRALWAN